MSQTHTGVTDAVETRAGGRATGRNHQGSRGWQSRRAGRDRSRDNRGLTGGVDTVSITDWLPRTGASGYVHYECRDCGRNLTVTDDACPACGGLPAEYVLD